MAAPQAVPPLGAVQGIAWWAHFDPAVYESMNGYVGGDASHTSKARYSKQKTAVKKTGRKISQQLKQACRFLISQLRFSSARKSRAKRIPDEFDGCAAADCGLLEKRAGLLVGSSH